MSTLRHLLAIPVLLCAGVHPLLVPGTAMADSGDQLSDSLDDLSVRDIVLFLTDDQRFDSLWAMPVVQERLQDAGIDFQNAYVTTPLCCPTRASLLSGGYLPSQVGVLTNTYPNGSILAFPDSDTLATHMQDAGYYTAMVGKYMNLYEDFAPYVPPGWSSFVSMVQSDDWYDFQAVTGSSTSDSSGSGQYRDVNQYITDFQRDQAIQAIQQAGDSPIFLVVGFAAPHFPAQPAEQDSGTFDGFQYRGGAWNEQDLSDKPSWLREYPLIDNVAAICNDDNWQRQLESLQSVDRAVDAILDTLDELGRLDSALLMYTSDNSQLWGEHRLVGKGVPYQEAVHVPLLVAHSQLEPGSNDDLVAVNLDLPATILEVAGVPAMGSGGSIMPLLIGGDSSGWRDHITLQNWSQSPPTWAALVTRDWKYMEYGTGETELYDLSSDPYEESSLHDDPDMASIAEELSLTLAQERGLAITSSYLDISQEDQPYEFQLQAWGGEEPYTWSISSKALPDELELSSSGIVSGVPLFPTVQEVVLLVSDSSRSAFTGLPQGHYKNMFMRVVDDDWGVSQDDSIPGDHPACSWGGSPRGAGPWALLPWLLAPLRRKGRSDT